MPTREEMLSAWEKELPNLKSETPKNPSCELRSLTEEEKKQFTYLFCKVHGSLNKSNDGNDITI